MKKVQIEEYEFPYEDLEQVGLTREMIEDLPMKVIDDLSSGRCSPMLPVKVKTDDSEVIESRARFAFVRVENGKIEALFYPKLKSSPLEQFSKEQREALMSGKTIISSVKFDGGSSSSAFVQVDQETLQVVAAPTAIITRNLKVLADELGLSASEVKCIQNGEPLTFIIDDEQTTVGIDLNEKVGLRITEGDANKWREQNKRIGEKYTFGCYGCWIMDNEGNLDYVREEDFTEELWEEQRKSAQRNVSSSLHK